MHMNTSRFLLLFLMFSLMGTAVFANHTEDSSDENFIVGLHQKDAHMIGYTVATERVVKEEKQKKDLLFSKSLFTRAIA